MAGVNRRTMEYIAPFTLILILGFYTDLIFGRPSGAPPSACSSTLSPQHGFNPQTSTSPYSLVPGTTVYGSLTQTVAVTVSWPSSVYLRGLILQARRVGDSTPVGTWSIGTSDQGNFKLTRCDHDDDTITHSNRNDKTGSVTFSWHPPSTPVGTVLFIASFVQSFNTYWVQVYSSEVVDTCLPNPCLFGGTCNNPDAANPTCTCPAGLTGPNCNSCNLCFNNGICTPVSSNQFSCACPNGFTGERCETNLCNPSPCFNNGVCSPTSNGYTCQCTSGYTGTHCETIALEGCDSSPCRNGGMCFNGGGGTYICQCASGYTGTHCETVIASPCASSPCVNEGTCYALSDDTTYLCQCKEGFTGLTCDIPPDACSPNNPCQNGATCVVAEQTTLGFLCMCAGTWVGTLCEREPCDPNPCYFGGNCYLVNNERGYNCDCMTGYTGSNCETPIEPSENPCDSDPCLNGAMCYQSDNIPPTYFCNCANGFTGTNCETQEDPCSPDPCQNGGACNVVTASNTYHCSCTPLYIGTNCETMINPCDSNPCFNNGACSFDTSGYSCSCPQYYGGERCQLSWCVSQPCQNGGTCTNNPNGFTCECTDLYSGTMCENLDIDPCQLNPCGNNGQCSSVGTTFLCDCNLGWTGVRCNTEVCTPGICQNGGVCVPSDTVMGYTCNCPSSYTGSHCETPAPCNPNPCQNGGQCIISDSQSFTCNCPSTHTGTLCDLPVPCNPNPCQNGGQCTTSGPFLYTCNCPSTHTGTNCETPVNPCRSSPCMNGATCEVYASGAIFAYTCACLPTFQGVHCETYVDPCSLLPCKNGGQCATSADGNSFTCSCLPTYTGATCEIVDPCIPNPCMNDGQCRLNADGTGYVCFCLPPYEGLTCSDIMSPCGSAPCRNGGQCSDNSNGYSCSCPSTHTGFNCEITVVDVCNSNPCKNNGRCDSSGNSYICFCIPPYDGDTCEGINPCQLSTINCMNGGTCVYNGVPGTFSCRCPPGYSGNTCDIGPCSSNPCHNGATCFGSSQGYTCTCPIGFLGTNCDTADPTCSVNPPCQNGGTCTLTGPQEYRCDCRINYSGGNCETYSDPCEDRGPCVTGTCLNLGDSHSCVCGDDYTGEFCEQSRCTGTEDGCLNEGVCTGSGGMWTCQCAIGFAGIDCSDTVSLPPTFDNCPDGDLTYSLKEGTITAVITQQPITARDSNRTPLPVTKESGPDLEFNGDLEVTFEEDYREGVEFVFTTSDFSQATASCSFKIKLVDDEVPTVECPNDIREVTTEARVPVIFEVKSVSDNLGEPTVTYSRTIQDQELPLESGDLFEADGLPKSVIVNVKDSFDNEAFCPFTVTVYRKDEDCSHFPEVDNGEASCDVNIEGNRQCFVACEDGYFLSVPSPASYTCKQNNVVKETAWQPTPNANSICLAISEGSLMKVVSVIFGIEADDCVAGDRTFENNIIEDIIKGLSAKGLCILNNIDACEKDNYEVKCGDVGNTRRRRAITDLTVGIGVSGNVDSNDNVTNVQNDIDKLAEQIRILADMGSLMVTVNGEMIPSQEDEASVSMEYTQTCLPGQMPVDNGGCVSCPAGTFYNAESEQCEFCDADTYQDEEEQSTCKACPEDMVTTATGSYALEQCKDKAPQETIWSTTLIAVIAAAGGLVVLLVLLIIILCCCRICCVGDDDFSDNIGNLTHLNKAYEEDDEQEMTFTGTLDNGRASVRTYQSIPGAGNGYVHEDIDDSELSSEDRLVRIPSMSASVYNYNEKPANGDAIHMGNGGIVPDSPPPPPPLVAPAPPPPPPPPPV